MKYIKYLFLGIFIILSFYLTEKIIAFLEDKNPIMKEISEVEHLYNTLPINAYIENNTIIPGIKGKTINKRKTFSKMENFGSFNEVFIFYNYIKPEISLLDNLDKVIVKGNPIKRTVSFIVEDSKITDYFDKERIPYAVIANINSDFSKDREYILGEERHEEISDLNSLLNKNKINSKICVINYSNLDYCLEKKYFIIAPTIQTESNIITLLSNINSGSIILIKKGANIDNIKLIKQEINKQDLKIEYLSEHITENS